nr:CotY/CotZ family spore coat protein [Bacillus sp. J33]
MKKFDGKCAILELLTFKQNKSRKVQFKNALTDFCSPCSQIDSENVDDLIQTGICINVDLACFCGVTCLPAVRL